MTKYIIDSEENLVGALSVADGGSVRYETLEVMAASDEPPVDESTPAPEPEPEPEEPVSNHPFEFDRDIEPEITNEIAVTRDMFVAPETFVARESNTRYLLGDLGPLTLGLINGLNNVEFVGGQVQCPWRYEDLVNIKFLSSFLYDSRGRDAATSFKVDGLTLKNCVSRGYGPEVGNGLAVDDYVCWNQECRNFLIEDTIMETAGRQAAIRTNHASNVKYLNSTFRTLMTDNSNGAQRPFRIHGTGENYLLDGCRIEGRGGYVGCGIIGGEERDDLSNLSIWNTHFEIWQNGLPLAGSVLECYSYMDNRRDLYPRGFHLKNATSNLGTGWIDGIRQFGEDKGWVIE